MTDKRVLRKNLRWLRLGIILAFVGRVNLVNVTLSLPNDLVERMKQIHLKSGQTMSEQVLFAVDLVHKIEALKEEAARF